MHGNHQSPGLMLAEAVGWARFERTRGWPSAPVRLGRYELRCTLGHGGMGHVFAAWDPELDRCVALKVLDRVDPEALALAQHEARCLARLAHPNVVCVHEVGEAVLEGVDRQGTDDADRRAYLAMELIEGAGIRAEPRSWRATLDCLLAAGRGLAAIHDAGLIHGDFKTGNVLIGRDGVVRVIDLGLASERTPGESFPSPASRTGTVPYMAPERLEGGPADAGADQWGFCVTAWELLFGVLPFGRWTTPEPVLAAIASGRLARGRGSRAVPAGLERVLRRGLAEDPADRPRSMTDLLVALERAGELPERRRAALRRSVVAAALALALAGVGVLTHERERCRDEVEALDRQWNRLTRARLEQRFMAADLPTARADFEWVAGRLDRWASQWRDRWASACIDCEGGPEVECLLGQRADFTALLDLLLDPGHPGVAPTELLHASRSLVAQLDPPGVCGTEDDDDEVLALAAGERRLALVVEAGAHTRASEELAALERTLERMPAGEVRERSTLILDRWRARLLIERGASTLAGELLRDALDRAALAGPALADVRLALLFERLRLHARSEVPSLELIRDDGSAALSLVERSGSAALHLRWAQAYGEALARVDVDSALAVLEPTLDRLTRRSGSARVRLALSISVAELLDHAGQHDRAAQRWSAALALAESLHGEQAIALVPVVRGQARNATARHDAPLARERFERLDQLLGDTQGDRAQLRVLAPGGQLQSHHFSGSMHE